MSTLGDPLDEANFGPLEAIFQRRKGVGPREKEPIERAAIVRLTDSIYERYVKPVVSNEQTKSFLERLPPQARAGFIGGALARAGYNSAGEIQANLPKHPGECKENFLFKSRKRAIAIPGRVWYFPLRTTSQNQ